MVYLQITLNATEANRPVAAAVYQRFKSESLDTIAGGESKELLVRAEDVQLLNGFDTVDHAQAYLRSPLFSVDVEGSLQPLLASAPDARVYQVA